jgi:hypothetical protein
MFTFIGNGVGLPPNAISGTPTMLYDILIQAETSQGGECLISESGEQNGAAFHYNITSNGTTTSDCQSGGSLTLAPLYGPYDITFSTYNQTGNGKEIASASATFKVNFNLATPTISLSTNALDVGQSATIDVSWNYSGYSLPTGTPPFTVKLYSNSNNAACGGSGATLVDSANDISSYSESFTVSPTATGTTYYCAVVNDSSYGDPEIKSSTIIPLYVAGTPSIRLSVTKYNYDQGQPATFGFNLGGGIGPFEVSLISSPSNTQIGNTLTLSSPGSSGSFTFNVPDTTGSYDYYVKVIDEETNNGGTNPYTFESSGSPDSIQYTVNPTLSIPSISLSSSRVEQGQPFSASLSWTGGTEPYTANVYVYNAISNALVTGLTGLSLSGISSDTANIPIQSNEIMPGTYYLKAVVSDSSGTDPETNSSVSGNFVVIAAPKITETLSSNSLTYPNFPTIGLQVVNGTPPYSATIDIVNASTESIVESNSISLTAANNIATYPTNVLAPGSYFANITLSDSATPTVTVHSSDAFVINKLTPTLALKVPASFTYDGANATVTGSVYPLGLTGNLIMSVNGGTGIDVAALTSTSNTLTYNAPASAGSYSFTLATDANSIYSAESTSANSVYTISKAVPGMHLSGIPQSFIYTGNAINATATFSISNTLQPLGGTLTLNGNLIATYSANALGHVQTLPVNAISIGNYIFEFKTPGNTNYTAANVIESFVIFAAAAHTTISVPHSFTYNGSNATIAASISPSNAIGNLYMSVNGGPYSKVDSSTAGFGSITYNAPAAAGNYSFEFYNTGNVTYAEGFSIGNYSIYKALPKMSFPQSCSTYTVDGLSCNTIASIETYNSQITAKLYLNGTLVGSTSNTITDIGSNAIGLYTYVFNETGNANYSADSITYAYEVQAPGSGHATSTSTSTATTTMPYIVNSTTTSISTTTTVPQHTLNISSSTTSYTGSFGTSAGKPYKISFGNLGMFVSFATPSPNSTNVNFTIANYTGSLPFFANHTKIKAFILNFTSAGNITANITTTYDCASGYPTAPYELVNGSLQPIVPYTVNPVTCTMSFSVSSDPIVALYSNTTVPTTTIAPTPVPTTTVPAVPKPTTSNYGYIIIALVVIVILAVIAYALTRGQKGR